MQTACADPFVAQLAALCRTQATRAKWVIVPSHAVGRMLGERLVLEGTNWANLRFTTPFSLALDTAAPWLIERGIDPVGDDIGPALIMRAASRPAAAGPRGTSARWRRILKWAARCSPRSASSASRASPRPACRPAPS